MCFLGFNCSLFKLNYSVRNFRLKYWRICRFSLSGSRAFIRCLTLSIRTGFTEQAEFVSLSLWFYWRGSNTHKFRFCSPYPATRMKEAAQIILWTRSARSWQSASALHRAKQSGRWRSVEHLQSCYALLLLQIGLKSVSSHSNKTFHKSMFATLATYFEFVCRSRANFVEKNERYLLKDSNE